MWSVALFLINLLSGCTAGSVVLPRTLLSQHMCVSGLQGWCFGVMGQRLARRVRILFLQAVLRQEMGWFDSADNSSGEILSRLSSDISALKGAASWGPARNACLASGPASAHILSHHQTRVIPDAGAVGDALGALTHNVAMLVIGMALSFTMGR